MSNIDPRVRQSARNLDNIERGLLTASAARRASANRRVLGLTNDQSHLRGAGRTSSSGAPMAASASRGSSSGSA